MSVVNIMNTQDYNISIKISVALGHVNYLFIRWKVLTSPNPLRSYTDQNIAHPIDKQSQIYHLASFSEIPSG